MMFQEKDIERYSRQLILDEIGPSGQDKLLRSSVLVIGAGGLGAPLLLYLAGAGVGRIGIMDFDSIQVSNLHRQTLYRTSDVGKLKVDVCATELNDLNPTITINVLQDKFTGLSEEQILNHDLVIDCSDSIETRYAITKLCKQHGKPYIIGAIHRDQGQFGLFNWKGGPNYNDLFPENRGAIDTSDCNETGVLAPLCGMIASFQSDLAIRCLLNDTNLENDLFYVLKTRNYALSSFKIKTKRKFNQTINQMKRIEPNAFFKLDKSEAIIVDVREVGEEPIVDDYNRLLIPLGEVPSRMNEIPKNEPVFMICRSGRRSENAILFLEQHGYTNLINVEGGTLGFIDEKMNAQ